MAESITKQSTLHGNFNAEELESSYDKNLSEIPVGSPLTGTPNIDEVGSSESIVFKRWRSCDAHGQRGARAYSWGSGKARGHGGRKLVAF